MTATGFPPNTRPISARGRESTSIYGGGHIATPVTHVRTLSNLATVDAGNFAFSMDHVAADAWDFGSPVHQVGVDTRDFGFPVDHVTVDTRVLRFPMDQVTVDG